MPQSAAALMLRNCKNFRLDCTQGTSRKYRRLVKSDFHHVSISFSCGCKLFSLRQLACIGLVSRNRATARQSPELDGTYSQRAIGRQCAHRPHSDGIVGSGHITADSSGTSGSAVLHAISVDDILHFLSSGSQDSSALGGNKTFHHVAALDDCHDWQN